MSRDLEEKRALLHSWYPNNYFNKLYKVKNLKPKFASSIISWLSSITFVSFYKVTTCHTCQLRHLALSRWSRWRHQGKHVFLVFHRLKIDWKAKSFIISLQTRFKCYIQLNIHSKNYLILANPFHVVTSPQEQTDKNIKRYGHCHDHGIISLKTASDMSHNRHWCHKIKLPYLKHWTYPAPVHQFQNSFTVTSRWREGISYAFVIHRNMVIFWVSWRAYIWIIYDKNAFIGMFEAPFLDNRPWKSIDVVKSDI